VWATKASVLRESYAAVSRKFARFDLPDTSFD
jgi:hypothetical protein